MRVSVFASPFQGPSILVSPPRLGFSSEAALVSSSWVPYVPPPGPATGDEAQGFIAAFDRQTGAPVPGGVPPSSTGPAANSELVPGSNVTVGATDVSGARPVTTIGPPAVGVRSLPASSSGVQSAGRFIATVTGTGGTSPFGGTTAQDGWRTVEVYNRSTGKLVYRVTASALTKRAVPGHADGRIYPPQLMDDGSLGVVATRRANQTAPSPARRGVRPVYVSSSGKVRILAARQTTRAVLTGALYAHGRGLVLAQDAAPRNRPTCSAYWVTNSTGTRGTRLAKTPSLVRDNDRRRARLPITWTGNAAIWRGQFRGAGRPQVVVDHGLKTERLTKKQRPRC